MSDFVEWLAEEVSARRWNYSELARQAGLSPAGVSQVMSGKNGPGLQFCFGVSQALDLPPERVLRAAGFLPARGERDEKIEEILHYFSKMTAEEQEYYRRIGRALVDGGRLRGGDEVGEG